MKTAPGLLALVAIASSLFLHGCDSCEVQDDGNDGRSFADYVNDQMSETPKESKPDPVQDLARRVDSAEAGIAHLILENGRLKAQIDEMKPCSCEERLAETAASSEEIESLRVQVLEISKLQTDAMNRLESRIDETVAAMKATQKPETKATAPKGHYETRTICQGRSCYTVQVWVPEK